MSTHPEFSHSRWRSASGGGNCVEVAYQDGRIGIRDSKRHGRGPILVISVHEWKQFIDDMKGDRPHGNDG